MRPLSRRFLCYTCPSARYGSATLLGMGGRSCFFNLKHTRGTVSARILSLVEEKGNASGRAKTAGTIAGTTSTEAAPDTGAAAHASAAAATRLED